MFLFLALLVVYVVVTSSSLSPGGWGNRTIVAGLVCTLFVLELEILTVMVLSCSHVNWQLVLIKHLFNYFVSLRNVMIAAPLFLTLNSLFFGLIFLPNVFLAKIAKCLHFLLSFFFLFEILMAFNLFCCFPDSGVLFEPWTGFVSIPGDLHYQRICDLNAG